MYLKELYNASKPWFLVVVVFIIAQLYINYKWGLVSTPFFNYGMYSSPQKNKPTINVFEIEVNHKILQPYYFAAQQWDKIMQPLYAYDSLLKGHNKNLFLVETQRHLLKLGITANKEAFIQPIDSMNFTKWYITYLQKNFNTPLTSVKVTKKLLTISNTKTFSTTTTKAILNYEAATKP